MTNRGHGYTLWAKGVRLHKRRHRSRLTKRCRICRVRGLARVCSANNAAALTQGRPRAIITGKEWYDVLSVASFSRLRACLPLPPPQGQAAVQCVAASARPCREGLQTARRPDGRHVVLPVSRTQQGGGRNEKQQTHLHGQTARPRDGLQAARAF